MREQRLFYTTYGPAGLRSACLGRTDLAVSEVMYYLQPSPARLSWRVLLKESGESQGLTVLGRAEWEVVGFFPPLPSDFVVIKAVALGVCRR